MAITALNIRHRRLSRDVQRYATICVFEMLNRCTISRETPRKHGIPPRVGLLREQGVAGSNPAAPTNKINTLDELPDCVCNETCNETVLLIIHREHDTSHSRVNSLLLFVGQISAALLININQNAESGTQ